jgi:hypothetical protein
MALRNGLRAISLLGHSANGCIFSLFPSPCEVGRGDIETKQMIFHSRDLK